MCICLSCQEGKLSHSTCYSEMQVKDVPSIMIYCSVLERAVVNVPNPRIDLPVPNDCPKKDTIKDKTLGDYIKSSF